MSYSYVDANNVQHVVGFVDVAVAPPGGGAGDGNSSLVSTTGVGITVQSHPNNGTGITLGYSKNIWLTLSNNACIDIASAGFCASRAGVAAVNADNRQGKL